MHDLKCKLVQKAVYAKLYPGHKPNEWEPWKESTTTILENGMVLKNDLQYGAEYPNSFLDIWYPDNSGQARPVIVYFHGGGFIFGDKSSGDPLAEGGGSSDKLLEIVRAGYILVNCNYAMAPEYRFPVQIQQVDQVMRYLLEHAQELRLDMSRVCLSGGSAGADLTEIYGVCVANPKYAEKLNVSPVMTMENLKVLAIDEAALDCRVFDANMFAMLGCWTNAQKDRYEDILVTMNAKEHIADTFIPTWVNASNEGGHPGYFAVEALALAEKLRAIQVPCDLVYFPEAGLPHGYMDCFKSDPYGKEAFDRMMAFIQKYI